MRCALVLNLLGTALLFFSFQATSSNVRLIRTDNGNTAFCLNDYAPVTIQPNGTWLMNAPCPNVQKARPIAIVNIERPILVSVGFSVLVAGFLLQLLAIPSAKTIARMRKELKESAKKEKSNKKTAKKDQHSN
jgi:hypothetical protein